MSLALPALVMAVLLGLAALLHRTRDARPRLGRALALALGGLLALYLLSAIARGDLLRPAPYAPEPGGTAGERIG